MGNSTNHKYLKQLGDFFPQILNSDERAELYLKDISNIQLDTSLLPAILDGKEVELDDWWQKVMLSEKYSFLSLVVEACLSVFSGPIVEGTFSTLNMTMDKQRNRLDCETYDSILKCKMYQKSTGKSASDMYHREDPLHSPVDLTVCKSMRLASSRYNKSKKEKKTTLHKRINAMGGKPTLPRTKKDVKSTKSVHEVNNKLKDMMEASAAGKGMKEVSRSDLPEKRKGDMQCKESGSVGDAPQAKKRKQSNMYLFLNKSGK